MDDIRPSEMKKRRHIIALIILVGCINAVLAAPNVILIVTDDQGYGDMSCHGNPDLVTPEIDRLIKPKSSLALHSMTDPAA